MKIINYNSKFFTLDGSPENSFRRTFLNPKSATDSGFFTHEIAHLGCGKEVFESQYFFKDFLQLLKQICFQFSSFLYFKKV